MSVARPGPSEDATVGSRPSQRCVIFLHLPKTAGTTIAEVMRRQYRPEEFLLLANARTAHEDFDRLDPATRARLRGIRGHVFFGIHEGLTQPWTYVTLLRQPVERVLSLYGYVWTEPRHPLHARVREEDVGLERFVAGDLSKEAINGQTRRIAGIRGPVDDRVLATARGHLRRHFSVVGLTERFDQSLLLLQRTLGWRRPYYAALNVTRERLRRADVPPRVLALIEERNAFDLELYDVARGLFEEQVEAQGRGFEREARAFRRRNRLAGTAWNAKRRARTLARRVLGGRSRS